MQNSSPGVGEFKSEKNLARAHLRARRAAQLVSLWKLKNHGILAQVAEYSERARAEVRARQNFF